MASFRKSVMSPFLVVSQMICNQCVFYAIEAVLMLLWTLFSNYRPNMDHVFIPATVRPMSVIQILSATILGIAFSYIVKRAKNCLDFACTLHIWHLILVICYNGQFPTQITWWFLQIISVTTCTIIGEYCCMKKEMAEIPLTSIITKDQRKNSNPSFNK